MRRLCLGFLLLMALAVTSNYSSTPNYTVIDKNVDNAFIINDENIISMDQNEFAMVHQGITEVQPYQPNNAFIINDENIISMDQNELALVNQGITEVQPDQPNNAFIINDENIISTVWIRMSLLW